MNKVWRVPGWLPGFFAGLLACWFASFWAGQAWATQPPQALPAARADQSVLVNPEVHVVYVVRQGDTLHEIRKRLLQPNAHPIKAVQLLAGDNRLRDPDLILPGQRLRIEREALAFVPVSAVVSHVSCPGALAQPPQPHQRGVGAGDAVLPLALGLRLQEGWRVQVPVGCRVDLEVPDAAQDAAVAAAQPVGKPMQLQLLSGALGEVKRLRRNVLEAHVQVFPGVSYTAFLVPGLVMMSVLQNAFANSSSSLIQSKITGNLVFVLLAPLSHWEL